MEVNNLSSNDDDRKQPAAAAVNPAYDSSFEDDNEPFIPTKELYDKETEYDECDIDDTASLSSDDDSVDEEVLITLEDLRDPSNNECRENVKNKVLTVLKNELGLELVKRNVVFTPETKYDDEFKKDKRHLKNTSKAVIYYAYPNGKRKRKRSNRKKGKVGRTTDGVKRVTIKGSEYDADEDIIIYIFDYEYADDDIINKLLPKVSKKIQGMEGITLDNIDINLEDLTIDKAKKLSDEGLDIFVRIYKHSLADKRLNGNINGAAFLAGLRRASDLQDAENGLQGVLEDWIDESSAPHEDLQSNLSDWLMKTDAEVENRANKLLTRLYRKVPALKDPNYADLLAKICMTLSWPREHDKEDVIDAAKPLIGKVVLGEDTMKLADSNHVYNNAIPEPPSLEKDKMFDSSEYTPQDKKKGFNEKIEPLVDGMANGEGPCVHVLDTNDMVMKVAAKKTMVKWLIEDKHWEVVDSCYNLVVLKKDIKNGKPCVLFVVRPWCWMLYAGDEPEGGDKFSRYNSQLKTAKTAHLCQAVIYALKRQSKKRVQTTKTIFNNILAAFAMRVYLLENVHIYPKVASLFAKNMLWKHDNLFKSKYHDMAASKFGVTKGQQQASMRGQVPHTRRYWITRDMQNCLSRIGLEGEHTLKARVSDVVDMTAVVGREGKEVMRQELLNHLYEDYVDINGTIGGMIQSGLEAACEQHRINDEATQMQGEKDEGLDIFVRIYKHSLADKRLNGNINGAAFLAGLRRASDLQDAENGLQGVLEDWIDESSAPHEDLQSNLSDWLMKTDAEVENRANKLLTRLYRKVPALKDPNYADLLAKICMTLSWPREHDKEDVIDAAKPLIGKVVLGEDTMKLADSNHVYNNAIPEPPSLEKDKMFDSSEYTPQDKKKGFNEKIEPLVDGMANGEGPCVHVLDTNDMVMKVAAKKTMVKWLIEDKHWEVVDSCYNLVVLKKDIKNGKPCVLFVVRPWCWMLYAGDEPEGGDKFSRYNSQLKTAKTAHLCQAVIYALKRQSKKRVQTTKTIFNNILAAFAMRVYLLENVHIYPKVASLFAKNMLWKHDNLFKSKYHDMAASKFGVTKGQQQASMRGQVPHTRRYWITRDMQNCLSRIGLEGEHTLKARVSDVVDMTAVVGREGKEVMRQELLNHLYEDYVDINGTIGGMIQSGLEAACEQHRINDEATQMQGEKGDNIRAAKKAMETL